MINFRVTVEGTSLRTEPKFIVFLTQLLLLFKFCHHCKTDNPVVETTRVGTAMVVTTTCSNAKCGRKNVWRSQPYMPGTKAYAGNFLLCFAILVSGGSASKVIHMFQHMGLSCISLATFFTHQRVCKHIISSFLHIFIFFIYLIIAHILYLLNCFIYLFIYLIVYLFIKSNIYSNFTDQTVSYNIPSLEALPEGNVRAHKNLG